jgi:hypothetical protein
VKSHTHFSLGRVALKSRQSRSGARRASGSRLVVKRFFALVAPQIPWRRMSRATWSRPTSWPARLAAFQSFLRP